MSRTVHVTRAPRAAVWEVLADGWLFPLWVVGASRIRDVDGHWPAADSRLHHSFGLWPAVIDDHTRVLESDDARRLVLLARGWPAGEARVELQLADRDDGTEVTLHEQAVSGPGSWVPKPVEDALLRVRNAESLRRLGWLAEGRATGDHTQGPRTTKEKR